MYCKLCCCAGHPASSTLLLSPLAAAATVISCPGSDAFPLLDRRSRDLPSVHLTCALPIGPALSGRGLLGYFKHLFVEPPNKMPAGGRSARAALALRSPLSSAPLLLLWLCSGSALALLWPCCRVALRCLPLSLLCAGLVLASPPLVSACPRPRSPWST